MKCCSLSIHNRGYQTSWRDGALDLCTGFTGVHYAYRHWELSGLCHKVICLIECIPLLGGITAIIERIAFALFSKRFADLPWKDSGFKMEEALIKANELNRHYPGIAKLSHVDFKPITHKEKFSYTHHAASEQGIRSTMEDAHFYKRLGNKGILAGVFDGHGGKDVAAYASQEVEKRFPEALEAANGDVKKGFEMLVNQIHCEVVEHAGWNSQGSTAVICYIDKQTNRVYTATVGDAEAHLYRKVGYPFWKSTKAIPLSLVENWASPDAMNRLVKHHGIKKEDLPLDPKAIRSQIEFGVNVSNAIGDVDQTGTVAKPLVTHKPSITSFQLERGDRIVLGCDGLWDFGKDEEITSIVEDYAGVKENLAEVLVDYALEEKESTDNVSVLTIGVA